MSFGPFFVFMAVPVVASVGSVSTGTSASATTAAPAGVTNGDLLRLALQTVYATTVNSGLTGWTPAQSVNSGSGTSALLSYHKIADGNNDTPTIVLSSSQFWRTCIRRITGADASPYDTGGVSGSGASEYVYTVATPSLTIAEDDTLLICEASSQYPETVTWPAGFTEHLDDNTGGPTLSAASKEVDAGSYSGQSVTFNDSGYLTCIGTAYKASGAPAPPAASGSAAPFLYQARTQGGTLLSVKTNIAAPVLLSLTNAQGTTEVLVSFRVSAKTSDSLEVERSIDGSVFAFIGSATGNKTVINYVDNQATVSGTYTYRARRLRGQSRYSNYSNELSIQVQLTLGPPTDLTATAVSPTRIDLAWVPPNPAPQTYTVQRSTDSGDTWSDLVTGLTTLTYSDTGLTPSTRYDYQVLSIVGEQSSTPSTSANATTPASGTTPTAPSGLSATALSSSSIFLQWTDNSNNETGFEVDRSLAGAGSWTQITTTVSNVTNYTATGLDPDTAYDFRVRATNATGDSANTSTATETTLEEDVADDPPTPPVMGAATSVTSVGATLNWTLTDTNGEVTVLAISRDGKASWQTKNVLGTRTSLVVSDLPSATEIFARAYRRSENGGISNSYSNTISFTTSAYIPGGAPDAPTVLRVLAAGDTEVFLDWQHPFDSEIPTAFEIQRSPAGAGTWGNTLTVNGYWRECYYTGLTASTSYDWRIRAINTAANSSYSDTVTQATAAGGNKWSGLTRDPVCAVTPRWKANWDAAKVAYDTTGTATWAGQNWAMLKAQSIDSAYPGYYRNAEAMMYVLTGDSTYAQRVFNHSAFSETTFKQGVVTGAISTTAFLTNLTGVGDNFYAASPFAGKLFWTSGANKDISHQHYKPSSSVGSTGQLNFAADNEHPFAPQVGDTFIIIDANLWWGNGIREAGIQLVTLFDMIYPGLTADQQYIYAQFLNHCCEICDGVNNHGSGWNSPISDSDQTTGTYFMTALWAKLAVSLGATVRTEFMTYCGGFDVSPPFFNDAGGYTSERNGLACWAQATRGGVWIESTEYDGGTTSLLAMGLILLRRAAGEELFPEFGPASQRFGQYLFWGWNPDGTALAKWGDDDQGYGMWQPSTSMSSATHQALCSGVPPLDTQMAGIVKHQYDTDYRTQTPYDRYFQFFDPLADTDALATVPLTFSGDYPRLCLYHRDGWDSTDTIFACRMFGRTPVDHSPYWLWNYQMYRQNERVMRAPLAYNNPAYYDNSANGFEICGLRGSLATGGPCAHANVAGEYTYVEGEQCGKFYLNESIYPIDTFQHEKTQCLAYMPSDDASSDTVITFIRALDSTPRLVPGLHNFQTSSVGWGGSFALSGTPTTTTLETNLPLAADNYYQNQWVLFYTGVLDNTPGLVSASTTTSGKTVLTISPALSQAPSAGDTFDYRRLLDWEYIWRAEALHSQIFHCPTGTPTQGAGSTSWTTPGGQLCEIVHLKPDNFTRSIMDESTDFVLTGNFGGTLLGENKWQIRIMPQTKHPVAFVPTRDYFLNVWFVKDPGVTCTATTITSNGGEAVGALITRTGHTNALWMFCKRDATRTHWDGFTVQWTGAANVYIPMLEPTRTWTKNLDGAGATSLTVGSNGIGKVTVATGGAHTLVLAAS